MELRRREVGKARNPKLALAVSNPEPATPVVPKTFRWLCNQYTASPEFKRLDPRTQRIRKRHLDKSCLEPTEPGAKTLFADFPLSRMTSRAIRVLRDRKADTPEAANDRLKAIRQAFKYGIEADLHDANPARDVPYFDSENEDGIHAWTLEEVQKYEGRWPIGSKARLALALLLYTAQRRSDVVKFGQKDIHDGWLRFTQFKGRKRKPVTMELPVVRPLREIIDATPGVGIKTFLVTDFGKPFSDAGFGNKFRTWCDAAGLPQCSAHGVRKATSAKLAELGCSDREIMSVTGHRTTKEVTRYTRSARQKILASRAMKKLDRASK